MHSVQLILAIIIGREDNRSADQDKDKPGNKKDTQRQTIDTQHQKLKTHGPCIFNRIYQLTIY